jgi:hypothetical protein
VVYGASSASGFIGGEVQVERRDCFGQVMRSGRADNWADMAGDAGPRSAGSGHGHAAGLGDPLDGVDDGLVERRVEGLDDRVDGGAQALMSPARRPLPSSSAKMSRSLWGYVTARVAERAFIAVGILSVLAVVILRPDLAGTGTDKDTLETVGRSLVAIKDWTFLRGPGFAVGVGNGLMLGYLMYRSGLVPRGMAMLGLIGGPLICLSGIAVFFAVIEAGSVALAIATVPKFRWKLSLGIYLIVEGFKPSPILSAADDESGADDDLASDVSGGEVADGVWHAVERDDAVDDGREGAGLDHGA